VRLHCTVSFPRSDCFGTLFANFSRSVPFHSQIHSNVSSLPRAGELLTTEARAMRDAVDRYIKFMLGHNIRVSVKRWGVYMYYA
jgi:hypothetical protein